MAIRWRVCLAALLTAGLCSLTGCFGVSANPRYFPWYCPPGDIIPTHARPPGHGYYANFDPYAVRVEVRPPSAVNPVGTQHVVLATVYSPDGKPLRNRRVEWMLEGVGSIVEVDESGHFAGRGYKIDNKYAVSYTNYHTHPMTRGNIDPKDDFVLRPGQSWCAISSAVEGDSYVSVYVPGIANWDKRKVTVNCRWVDATWLFPGPAAARAGTQHVFSTRIFRYSDKQPLANYRVRYTVLDGPPAVLLTPGTPGGVREAVVVSELDGNAPVTITQVQPTAGVNRVGIEVIRPPDPTAPGGVGLVLAKAETSIEWLAPQVSLNLTGPPTVPLNGEVPYTITLTNTGKVELRAMTVSNPIPDGLEFVRSDVQHAADGRTLVWTLVNLPPGQSRGIQAVFRATRKGEVTNCAEVVAEEDGLQTKDGKCVRTAVTQPGLQVGMTGPESAVVGAQVTYQITVGNPGDGVAENVVLEARFAPGLEHDSKANPIYLNLGNLNPNETRTLPLSLRVQQPGPLRTDVLGKADGGLTANASWTVTAAAPQMDVNLLGPTRRPIDGEARWNIRVVNPGDVPLGNVIVRDRLPPQLTFVSATDGGVYKDGEVVWDLGVLPARRERVLQIATRCSDQPGVATQTVVVAADSGLRQEQTATLQIYGVEGLEFGVSDTEDPLLVGKETVYEIRVRNSGSAPVENVEVTAKVPNELQLLGGEGPGGLPQTQGQVIRFGKIAALEPQQALTFKVRAEAKKAGDVRFQAELLAKGLRPAEPVIDTEATSIVDPTALGNGAVPPVNPPQPPQLSPPVPPVSLRSNPTTEALPSAPRLTIPAQ